MLVCCEAPKKIKNKKTFHCAVLFSTGPESPRKMKAYWRTIKSAAWHHFSLLSHLHFRLNEQINTEERKWSWCLCDGGTKQRYHLEKKNLCICTLIHMLCALLFVCLESKVRRLNLIPGLLFVWVHSTTPSPAVGTLSAGQRGCCYMRGFRCVITPIYSAGSSINTQLHTSLHLRFAPTRGTEKHFSPPHKHEWQQTLSKQFHFLLQLQQCHKKRAKSDLRRQSKKDYFFFFYSYTHITRSINS